MLTVRDRRARGCARWSMSAAARQARGRCRAIRSASLPPPRTGSCRRAMSPNLRRLAPGYRGARPAETGEIAMSVSAMSWCAAACRASATAPSSRTGAAPRPRRLGAGTGAMALWRRCFPAPEPSVTRRSSGLPARARPRAVEAVDVAEGGAELLASAVRASASRCWQRRDMNASPRAALLACLSLAASRLRHPRRQAAALPIAATRTRSRSRATATRDKTCRNGPTAAGPARVRKAATRSARTSASPASRRRSAAPGGRASKK